MRRVVAVVAAVLALVGTAGCSGLDGTGDANYTTGDGAITQIAAADREGALDIGGETLDGEPIDLASMRGDVVVLNVWGSWCTPCRGEAPVLQEASEQLDARFVGMSFRETSFENARSFEREFGITYPTIADEGAGVVELGDYAPKAPPTTYVLDRQGRVAAVVTGAITSAGTLEDLVEEVAAEDG
ncbi:TlpA disulfide reductase family protein [Nocardioides marinquilinus]|uniref:TlpA disulfide reductase family protein n=1 Tax=Nocardioides marinquilinus TaxID=1210400 RepID=A0ABP9PDN3_9ACTN